MLGEGVKNYVHLTMSFIVHCDFDKRTLKFHILKVLFLEGHIDHLIKLTIVDPFVTQITCSITIQWQTNDYQQKHLTQCANDPGNEVIKCTILKYAAV